MAIYVGENIGLRVRGTDGNTRWIIADADCVINLYAPGKDPVNSPEDRADPDYTVSATYDPVSRYYLATVSTNDWTPGTWAMQGVLSGGAEGYYAFDFESFTLCP